MAEELRWHHLYTSVADGTTSESGVVSFRNETSSNLFIRLIRQNVCVQGAGNFEEGTVEISKQSTILTGNSTGAVGFALCTDLQASVASGGADTDFSNPAETTLFAKGQLVLEPNEALYLNCVKTSGGVVEHRVTIGYHF